MLHPALTDRETLDEARSEAGSSRRKRRGGRGVSRDTDDTSTIDELSDEGSEEATPRVKKAIPARPRKVKEQEEEEEDDDVESVLDDDEDDVLGQW